MPFLPHAFPNASLCPLHCFTKRKNSVSPLLPFSPNGKIPRPHFCHFHQTEKFRDHTFAIFSKRKNSTTHFCHFRQTEKFRAPCCAPRRRTGESEKAQTPQNNDRREKRLPPNTNQNSRSEKAQILDQNSKPFSTHSQRYAILLPEFPRFARVFFISNHFLKQNFIQHIKTTHEF